MPIAMTWGHPGKRLPRGLTGLHAPHLQRIVSGFGGQNAMARALGLRQSTVWEWLQAGHVPSRRIPAVIEAAARLDPPLRLTPADFFASAAPQGAGAQPRIEAA